MLLNVARKSGVSSTTSCSGIAGVAAGASDEVVAPLGADGAPPGPGGGAVAVAPGAAGAPAFAGAPFGAPVTGGLGLVPNFACNAVNSANTSRQSASARVVLRSMSGHRVDARRAERVAA